ncbi:MAG: hypothetical protein NT157_02255 [Candidatus Micrarchaeota archaeon]|nr:hypothetical protein [Candidatus Micrarchaeota archaeon]
MLAERRFGNEHLASGNFRMAQQCFAIEAQDLGKMAASLEKLGNTRQLFEALRLKFAAEGNVFHSGMRAAEKADKLFIESGCLMRAFDALKARIATLNRLEVLLANTTQGLETEYAGRVTISSDKAIRRYLSSVDEQRLLRNESALFSELRGGFSQKTDLYAVIGAMERTAKKCGGMQSSSGAELYIRIADAYGLLATLSKENGKRHEFLEKQIELLRQLRNEWGHLLHKELGDRPAVVRQYNRIIECIRDATSERARLFSEPNARLGPSIP